MVNSCAKGVVFAQMSTQLPLDDWGFPIYDRMITVPKDGDYSRIDPRYHEFLKRWRPDMTPTERLTWLDEYFLLRQRVCKEDEARARALAMRRSQSEASQG